MLFYCTKEEESFHETFTNLYQAVLCHTFTLEVINHYRRPCEAMHLTNPLLKLVEKCRLGADVVVGNLHLHMHNPKI